MQSLRKKLYPGGIPQGPWQVYYPGLVMVVMVHLIVLIVLVVIVVIVVLVVLVVLVLNTTQKLLEYF